MQEKAKGETLNMGKAAGEGRAKGFDHEPPMVIRRAGAATLATLRDRIDALTHSGCGRRAQAVAPVFAAEAERARVAAILAEAVPPAAMAAAPVAPARGPMRLVEEITLLPGGTRHRTGAAYWIGIDPLSIMCRQAALRHAEAGGDAPFVPPFTPGQIAVGRDYAALVEWRAGSPLKCASLEAGRSGDGGSGLFIDGYIDRGCWLAELQRRIGSGSGLAVRRIRPTARGSRRSIPDRALVDLVVLGGRTLSEVLEGHGWSVKGSHRDALRTALCGALDRMQGYYGDLGAK